LGGKGKRSNNTREKPKTATLTQQKQTNRALTTARENRATENK
jgi:hypothetical protein